MSRKGWLCLSAACAVAFVILTVPILWGRDWPGEWAIVEWAVGTRSPFWTAVMQTVTFFGSSAVGLGLSTGLSAILVVRERPLRTRWRDRRLTWKTLWPLLAMVGAAPLNFGLRWAVGRYRPGVTYIPNKMPELRHPFQVWSFPSGHAMA
jgi:membrane-associated phospholipid phosphatase